MLCIGCKAPRRTSISPTQQKRAHPGLERGPFLYTVVLNTRPPLFSNLYLKGVIRGKKLYLVSRKTVVAFALRIQTTVPSVSRFLARLQRYGYICQIWRALKIALLSKQKKTVYKTVLKLFVLNWEAKLMGFGSMRITILIPLWQTPNTIFVRIPPASPLQSTKPTEL